MSLPSGTLELLVCPLFQGTLVLPTIANVLAYAQYTRETGKLAAVFSVLILNSVVFLSQPLGLGNYKPVCDCIRAPGVFFLSCFLGHISLWSPNWKSVLQIASLGAETHQHLELRFVQHSRHFSYDRAMSYLSPCTLAVLVLVHGNLLLIYSGVLKFHQYICVVLSVLLALACNVCKLRDIYSSSLFIVLLVCSMLMLKENSHLRIK